MLLFLSTTSPGWSLHVLFTPCFYDYSNHAIQKKEKIITYNNVLKSYEAVGQFRDKDSQTRESSFEAWWSIWQCLLICQFWRCHEHTICQSTAHWAVSNRSEEMSRKGIMDLELCQVRGQSCVFILAGPQRTGRGSDWTRGSAPLDMQS